MSQNFSRCVCSHRLRTSSQTLRSRRTRELGRGLGASLDWQEEEVRARLSCWPVHYYLSSLNSLDLAPINYSRWGKKTSESFFFYMVSLNCHLRLRRLYLKVIGRLSRVSRTNLTMFAYNWTDELVCCCKFYRWTFLFNLSFKLQLVFHIVFYKGLIVSFRQIFFFFWFWGELL